jgi:hypothetical protein
MVFKKSIAFFLIGIILVGNTSFLSPAQNDSQEYILKAAFLYRFTDYIQWPNQNDGQNFTIAVLGESGITAPLNEIAKDKKVRNNSMYIKEAQDINNIGSCQVLFVSRNYSPGIEDVVSKIGNKPILIVAEQPDACKKGAYINFIISEEKLKFEINLQAATKAGLHISSQLLQHAILVNTP